MERTPALALVITLGACLRQPIDDAETSGPEQCPEASSPIPTLTPGQSFAIELGSQDEMPAEMLAADFNGDGYVDLRAGQLDLFGDGQGGFVMSPPLGNGKANEVIEVDGLSGADVIAGDSIPRNEGDPDNPVPGYAWLSFYVGDSAFPVLADDSISFIPESNLYDWDLSDIAVGDFDADGDADVAASMVFIDSDQRWSQLWLLTNMGGFEFEVEQVDHDPRGTSVDAPPEFVVAGRLGSDSTIDVIWDETMFVGGPEGLSAVGDLPESIEGSNDRWLFGEDVTCDGIPDLLVGTRSGAFLLRGLAMEPFFSAEAEEIAIGPAEQTGWVPWDVGDLDGDGAPDIIFIGDGLTRIVSGGAAVAVDTPHSWIAARMVDVDGDGALDLVGTHAEPAGDSSVGGGIDILLATP